MIAVGIDTSTKAIAIGCYDGTKKVDHHIYRLTGNNINQQMAGAYNCMEQWLMERRVEGQHLKVYIEEPVYVQNFNTHMKLSCIYASVALACIGLNLFPVAVHNKTWKKEVLGNGNADKDEIRVRSLLMFDIEDGHEQDIYDALCVAKYGWGEMNG